MTIGAHHNTTRDSRIYLGATFDPWDDRFSPVSSAWHFAYLRSRFREKGATVYIVDEQASLDALRNVSYQFHKRTRQEKQEECGPPRGLAKAQTTLPARRMSKLQQKLVIEAVALFANNTGGEFMPLSGPENYLKRMASGFHQSNTDIHSS